MQLSSFKLLLRSSATHASRLRNFIRLSSSANPFAEASLDPNAALPYDCQRSYEENFQKSVDNPTEFWAEQAERIVWFKKYDRVLEDSNPVFPEWFQGGELNVCYNALDRHVESGLGDKVALIHDSPVTQHNHAHTYSDLLKQVEKLAGVLRSWGVGKGDRVLIYMPMIPEAIIGMLACARIGAIHVVVFGGFASRELSVRINHVRPKVILSASGGIEPGRIVEYKPMLDNAIELSDCGPERCLIYNRHSIATKSMTMMRGRDWDWEEEMAKATKVEEPLSLPSSHPLYIIHTSGTTGNPKGIVRPTGGHAVALPWTMQALYGMRPGEAWWAASDLGWVVGHSYIAYAPLLYGATSVLFEVRVCERCFGLLAKKKKEQKAAKAETPKLTEVDSKVKEKALKEVEEEQLQLAIALSQSEAEEKERRKQIHTKKEQCQGSAVQQPDRTDGAQTHCYMGYLQPEARNRSVSESAAASVYPKLERQSLPPSAPPPSSNGSDAQLDLSGTYLPTIPVDAYGETDSAQSTESFAKEMRTQAEALTNRIRSNQHRGRTIINDSGINNLFLNLTKESVHILNRLHALDERKNRCEEMQDKLAQVQEAREAVNVLREEHREKRAAEMREAERRKQEQRQAKLAQMRQKKHEMLEHQRISALQRMQEQEMLHRLQSGRAPIHPVTLLPGPSFPKTASEPTSLYHHIVVNSCNAIPTMTRPTEAQVNCPQEPVQNQCQFYPNQSGPLQYHAHYQPPPHYPAQQGHGERPHSTTYGPIPGYPHQMMSYPSSGYAAPPYPQGGHPHSGPMAHGDTHPGSIAHTNPDSESRAYTDPHSGSRPHAYPDSGSRAQGDPHSGPIAHANPDSGTIRMHTYNGHVPSSEDAKSPEPPVGNLISFD